MKKRLMSYELAEIKKIRKKLDLTQAELARRSGVSQSFITKIEAGLLDPSYSKTKQIFGALDELTKKEELTAEHIMKKKIITAKAEDKLSTIIKEMKKLAISQVPIIEKEKPIGLITETILLDRISSGEDITHLRAKEIMEDCPPIITPQTRMTVIANILHYFPIVLVAEKGTLKGLITKSDLIEKIV